MGTAGEPAASNHAQGLLMLVRHAEPSNRELRSQVWREVGRDHARFEEEYARRLAVAGATAVCSTSTRADGYERRQPEQTLLYRLVEQYWPRFREGTSWPAVCRAHRDGRVWALFPASAFMLEDFTEGLPCYTEVGYALIHQVLLDERCSRNSCKPVRNHTNGVHFRSAPTAFGQVTFKQAAWRLRRNRGTSIQRGLHPGPGTPLLGILAWERP